jgi:hypothetical protein
VIGIDEVEPQVQAGALGPDSQLGQDMRGEPASSATSYQKDNDPVGVTQVEAVLFRGEEGDGSRE